MDKEVVRNAIADGSTTGHVANVVETTTPGTFGLVICNSDGSAPGSPPSSANGKFFLTLGDLQAAYPTGNVGDWANVDGIIYTWNGSAWVSTNIPANSISDIAGESVNPMTTEDARKIMKYLQTLAIKASGGQLRTVVDNVVGGTLIVTQASASNLNATVTQSSFSNLNATVALASSQTLATVTTVGTLSDITNIGGINAKQLQFTNSRMNYAVNTRSRLSYT